MTATEIKEICGAIGVLAPKVVPIRPTDGQVAEIIAAEEFIRDGLDAYGLYCMLVQNNPACRITTSKEDYRLYGRDARILYYALLSYGYEDKIDMAVDMIANVCRNEGIHVYVEAPLNDEDSRAEIIYFLENSSERFALAEEYAQFIRSSANVEFSLHGKSEDRLRVLTLWGDILLFIKNII